MHNIKHLVVRLIDIILEHVILNTATLGAMAQKHQIASNMVGIRCSIWNRPNKFQTEIFIK